MVESAMKRINKHKKPMPTTLTAGSTYYLRRASHAKQPEKTFRSVDHLTLHRFMKELTERMRDRISNVEYERWGKGDKGQARIYAKAFPTKPVAIIPFHETTLREWCEWVWEMRRNCPFSLYKTSDLVAMFYDHPQKAKDSRSRMGRELRRVGFSLVPEGKRSEFWLINEDEKLTSLKTVGDVLKEYEKERDPVEGRQLSQVYEQRTLKRRKQELEKELSRVNTRLQQLDQLEAKHLAELFKDDLRASKRRT
jgi:hypothetical protein